MVILDGWINRPLSVLITQPDAFERALKEAEIRLTSAKKAVEELISAAEATEKSDRVQVFAQMARALEMWTDALDSMH